SRTRTAAPRAASIPTSRSCGPRRAEPHAACACAPRASRRARSPAKLLRAPGPRAPRAHARPRPLRGPALRATPEGKPRAGVCHPATSQVALIDVASPAVERAAPRVGRRALDADADREGAPARARAAWVVGGPHHHGVPVRREVPAGVHAQDV